MITLREVREQINADPKYWRIYLMDFVDDFRRCKDRRAIDEPFVPAGDRMDALMASTAEALCDELGFEAPEWLAQVPACDEPYFVSGFENLKAIAIVESPLRFRVRKIFVMENFLSRV